MVTTTLIKIDHKIRQTTKIKSLKSDLFTKLGVISEAVDLHESNQWTKNLLTFTNKIRVALQKSLCLT